MQRSADNDQSNAAIENGVAYQVNLTFVGHRAKQAQCLAPEDSRHTSCGKLEGESRRSLHGRY